MQSLWLLYKEKEPTNDVAVLPNAAVREGERTVSRLMLSVLA